MKITCEECGAMTHSIQIHIRDAHSKMTIDQYVEKHPGAKLLSEAAKKKIRNKGSKTDKIDMSGTSSESIMSGGPSFKRFMKMNEVFDLGESPIVKNSKGDYIKINVLTPSGEFKDMIPAIDNKYIFPIDTLKNVLMGLEMNIPVYLWGHAGVGKSTLYKQICARTNRPYIRIQHTEGMEECHIVGQMLANEHGTYFEPGALALAMRNGWLYNADEYDYAHASVVAIYQAVLEGEPLIIKEAPSDWRVIEPHEDFRFVATGNTNGSGDDSGLYSGTNIGNAANYSRFGVTDRVGYMDSDQEALVISSQSGIHKKDSEKIVEFARLIREAFDNKQMTSTVGPRELIYAGKLGVRKSSFKKGIELAFINRLNDVDMEISRGIAQRVFG